MITVTLCSDRQRSRIKFDTLETYCQTVLTLIWAINLPCVLTLGKAKTEAELHSTHALCCSGW